MFIHTAFPRSSGVSLSSDQNDVSRALDTGSKPAALTGDSGSQDSTEAVEKCYGTWWRGRVGAGEGADPGAFLPTPPSSSLSRDTLPLPGCSIPAMGQKDGLSHLLFASTPTLSTLSSPSPPASLLKTLKLPPPQACLTPRPG